MKRSAAEIGRDLQGYVARRYPHSSKISMMSIPQPLVEEAAAALARAGGDGWLPIAEAPKDGSYILAIVAPNRGRYLEHQAGRMFVIRHEGLLDSYDMGWAVYPGFGGASDRDFTVWRPLPAAPDAEGR